RLANTISEKTSASCAHLCTTTPLTPPAPIINTLTIIFSTKSSRLSLKIRVATHTLRKRAQHLLTISNSYSSVTHGLFGCCTKVLVHGIRIVFNVAQYIGNAVAVQLMHNIHTAIGIDAHTGDVGIAEQIM